MLSPLAKREQAVNPEARKLLQPMHQASNSIEINRRHLAIQYLVIIKNVWAIFIAKDPLPM